MKPPTPLQPKNARNTASFRPQRRCGFNPTRVRASKGDAGFRRAGRLVYRTQMRYPWPAAGPGRATSGRPTLQTSSNQHDSNRLARTSVTNVVNLSPKTSIFTEKAIELTTFVTPGQKSTQKTPWIDDVCNNTHRATRQHTRHHRCGGRRRVRRARAGFEIDHSEPQARVWRSRGRPGPTAPGTPAEPQATSSIANSGCAAGADGERAGRRPRAHKAARPDKSGPTAPETPAAPQAPPNREASELLVVLRILVGLAAVGAAQRADCRHLLRRQREREDVKVLALTLR